jgi:hypothetical protein
MKMWQKMVLVNVGIVAVCISTLFMVPPTTPLWIWAAVWAAMLPLANYTTYRSLRAAGNTAPMPASDRSNASKRANATLIVIVLILLIDLIYHLVHR